MNFWILGADKITKTWFLSTWQSTWHKAAEECKSHGMNLTTFDSEKEEAEDLLKSYRLLNSSSRAYIGYTDQGHEGAYTTFTGEKLKIGLEFHVGEPNNGGGNEDCLEIWIYNGKVNYNDVTCNYIFFFHLWYWDSRRNIMWRF